MGASIFTITEYITTRLESYCYRRLRCQAKRHFLDGNEKLCELLGLTESELRRPQLESFYLRRADRLAFVGLIWSAASRSKSCHSS